MSPAVLEWTPGADLLNVSQTVYRAPGACTSPLTAGVAVRTYAGNATAQHFAVPGDGTFCFSVVASDLAGGTASSAWRHGHDRHDAADRDGRSLGPEPRRAS